jgi:hypothetical protein
MGSVLRAFNSVAPCVCGKFCMTNRAIVGSWVSHAGGVTRFSATMHEIQEAHPQVHAAFLRLSSA